MAFSFDPVMICCFRFPGAVYPGGACLFNPLRAGFLAELHNELGVNLCLLHDYMVSI